MASREARERAIRDAARLVEAGGIVVRRAVAPRPKINDRYVPLSVRTAPPWSRKRIAWQVSSAREKAAIAIAPWLSGRRLY